MTLRSASAPLPLSVPALVLAAVCVAVALLPRPAAGEEPAQQTASIQAVLREVRDNLQIYESRVLPLAAKYVDKVPEGPSVYRLQSRINDGLVFFQLGEYERASFLLMEVVQEDANSAYVGYRDALFYLAESLYQMHNPIAATGFYQLVVEKNFRQYRKSALLRLVEICFATNQLESIDRYFGQLASEPGAANDPEVIYVHAKSLYFRKDYDKAFNEFAAVVPDTVYYHRARYFMGTIQVLKKQFQDAVGTFQQITGQPTPDLKVGVQDGGKGAKAVEDVEEVRRLAHLALGRLLYELGQFDPSIAEYQAVPRESPSFDRALFEICWTYIKKGDHEMALRALDILLLAAPESLLAPEATLLKGNLQLKLTKYADAQTTFQEIVDRFGPVREQLAKVLTEHADPEAFFRQLVGKNLDRFDVQVALPELATTWVKEEPSVGRALGVVKDVDSAMKDLAQAEELVRVLEDALTAENRIEIFPELQQAWKIVLESENALIVLKQQLNDEERKLIWDQASPAERTQYKSIAEQRAALEHKFQEIPRTSQGLAKREAKVDSALDELEKTAFRQGIEIDGLKAQLVAMDKWITDTAARRQTNGQSEAHVRASVLEQQQELQALEGELTEVRQGIARKRGGVGIGDAVGSAEAETKQRYDKVLGDEGRLLQALRSRLPPDQQQLLDQEDQQRQRITKLEDTIHRFYGAVRQAVDEKVRALRTQVEEEKKSISRFGRQVTGYRGMGENLAGKVAAASMRDVQTKFRSLVLQADVGIIDVAWQEKEEKSRADLDLVRERKTELENLDADFKPVLEEKL